MFRMLFITTAAVLAPLVLATPTQAGFTQHDLGRLLQAHGFAADFHPAGFYVVRHGGFQYRVHLGGGRIVFQVPLATLDGRDLRSRNFQQVLGLHQRFGFAGRFDHQGNQLYFHYTVDLDGFRAQHLDNHFRHIHRTLEQHHGFWHPRHWSHR